MLISSPYDHPPRAGAALKRPKLPSHRLLKPSQDHLTAPRFSVWLIKRRRLLYIQNGPGNAHWSRAHISSGFLAVACVARFSGPELVRLSLGHAHRFSLVPSGYSHRPSSVLLSIHLQPADASSRPVTTNSSLCLPAANGPPSLPSPRNLCLRLVAYPSYSQLRS